MRETIALVGLRCAGKTTVGRELARRLGWPFADLDERVVELARERLIGGRAGQPSADAAELLVALGLERFRDLESDALRDLLGRRAHLSTLVLATGGGSIERASNRAVLRERATVVWLRAPLDVLRRRIAADPVGRPSLTGTGAVEELEAIAAAREEFYAEVASRVVDCGERPPAEIAAEIRTWLVSQARGAAGGRGPEA